jgi:TfoX/Sxy family transcriptional regulator of competence genes
MSQWNPVPAALAEAFLAALPAEQAVQRRQMFGCPCAFVNGQMFAGLHSDRLIVRVPAEATARPCVIMGRTMREYALFETALELPPAQMAAWIRRGYDYALTLPPKAKKSRSAVASGHAAKSAAIGKARRTGGARKA